MWMVCGWFGWFVDVVDVVDVLDVLDDSDVETYHENHETFREKFKMGHHLPRAAMGASFTELQAYATY